LAPDILYMMTSVNTVMVDFRTGTAPCTSLPLTTLIRDHHRINTT